MDRPRGRTGWPGMCESWCRAGTRSSNLTTIHPPGGSSSPNGDPNVANCRRELPTRRLAAPACAPRWASCWSCGTHADVRPASIVDQSRWSRRLIPATELAWRYNRVPQSCPTAAQPATQPPPPAGLAGRRVPGTQEDAAVGTADPELGCCLAGGSPVGCLRCNQLPVCRSVHGGERRSGAGGLLAFRGPHFPHSDPLGAPEALPSARHTHDRGGGAGWQ